MPTEVQLVADSSLKVDISVILGEILAALPYFVVELYPAVLAFFAKWDVACPMFHVVFGAGQPVAVLDEDVKVVVSTASGVVLEAKSVAGHLRKIRIAVLASRVKSVAGEPGFAGDLKSFVMWVD